MKQRKDNGFTLAELLIVIVILGILATVTVFAVRGVTNRANEVACDVELDQLAKAEEVHLVQRGTYADEADLITAGTLSQPSTLYDATGDISSFSITASAGSTCSGSISDTGTPATPPAMTGTPVNFHGASAYRFPTGGSGNDEIIVIGRDAAQADWVATTDAGVTTTRRVHFINIDDLDAATLNNVVSNAQNNGLTDIAIYLGDDTTDLTGTSASTYDFLLPLASADANTTLRTMSGSGFNLQALIGITG